MPKVQMPQLGESVAEGTIGRWLKKVGDPVAKYEPLVEVITDKVNAEVPSPYEGTLTQILVEEGQTVPNNTEIAVVEAVGAAAEAPQEALVSSPAAGSQAVADETGQTAPPSEGQRLEERTVLGMGGHGPAGSDERPADGPRVATLPEPPAAPSPPSGGNGAAGPDGYQGRMTPAVRRLAREHGVDLAQIAGTGHAGRVTREDVLAHVERQRTGAAAPTAAAPATEPAAPSAPLPSATTAGGPATAPSPSAGAQIAPPLAATAAAPGQDELKQTTPMRRAIAAHMVKSKTTAPHAYTTVEVDMSGVVALRDAVKAQYQAREGVALSYVAIVAKAVVEGLRKHPDLNAHWTDEGLLRKSAINLGIAVAVDDGLIVPSIKNADQLSIHGLNLWVQDFAARARANKLRLEDVQGGTFTLNNTGWFGSVASQPIVNVPEIAILSMEAIVKRPVVVETPAGDTIGIRPIMNVCVSFDHRGTDGAQIGRFVQDVRRWLESAGPQTSVW